MPYIPNTQIATTSQSRELDYTTVGNVVVSSTAEGAPDTIITLPERAYNGSTIVMLEYYSASITIGSGDGTYIVFNLYDNGVDQGRWTQIRNNGTQDERPIHLMMRLTPSAGNHTYSVRGWRIFANTTLPNSWMRVSLA